MSRRALDLAPLTPAQARLVADHADWARRGAYKRAQQLRMPVEDLVSAAYLGLVHAARRFDPSRGYVFKTYAMPWCESLMRRERDHQRRAYGHVADGRVEGSMRQVLVRIDWPQGDDGHPVDLVTVPALHHDDVLRRQHVALLRRHARRRDRRILTLALDGHDAPAISQQIGITARAVSYRLEAMASAIRRRIEADRRTRRGAA